MNQKSINPPLSVRELKSPPLYHVILWRRIPHNQTAPLIPRHSERSEESRVLLLFCLFFYWILRSLHSLRMTRGIRKKPQNGDDEGGMQYRRRSLDALVLTEWRDPFLLSANPPPNASPHLRTIRDRLLHLVLRFRVYCIPLCPR